MQTITSRNHSAIKNVALLHQAKGRREQQRFIAEGTHVIESLIATRMHLRELYCLEDNPALLNTTSLMCTAYQYKPEKIITLISQSVLEKISCLTTPNGVVGIFDIPPKPALSELSNGIVLANIQSPGNMGTIIRTAAALKIPSVVIIGGADVWNPKIVQATAGTLGMVTLFECTWNELLASKKDVSLCALVVSGGQPIQSIDPSKALLVVGNEAEGIPDAWVKQCDTQVTLPMPGNTESLNAAVAVSIAMYINYLNVKI